MNIKGVYSADRFAEDACFGAYTHTCETVGVLTVPSGWGYAGYPHNDRTNGGHSRVSLCREHECP